MPPKKSSCSNKTQSDCLEPCQFVSFCRKSTKGIKRKKKVDTLTPTLL